MSIRRGNPSPWRGDEPARAGTSRALQLVLAATLLASCGEEEADTVPLPPPDAPHGVVLDTYLRALVAGDCETARALATESFTVGNGELCDAVEVSAFEPLGKPATPSNGEVVYSTVLTTSGDTDGSIEPGKQTWFYSLRRVDGEWRLVGGGSGP